MDFNQVQILKKSRPNEPWELVYKISAHFKTKFLNLGGKEIFLFKNVFKAILSNFILFVIFCCFSREIYNK